MKTTIEFLNAVKERHHLTSDGQLSKMLGITRSSTSLFMQGKNFLGDDSAMKVAALLDLDPAYVVACIHAERAKPTEEKKLWERIAGMLSSKELAGLAAALTVIALLPTVPMDNSLGNVAFLWLAVADDVYYVKLVADLFLCYWQPLSALALLALWGFPRYHPHPKKRCENTDKLPDNSPAKN